MKASVTWLFFLGACGGSPRDEAPPPKADAAAAASASAESSAVGPALVLTWTVWRLVELGGKPAPWELDGKPPTLELSRDGNQASGFAGCNRMSGTWELRGDSLRLGPFALTRMACFKGMDLEQAYLDALQNTRTFRLSAQGLELFGERGPLARLEAQ